MENKMGWRTEMIWENRPIKTISLGASYIFVGGENLLLVLSNIYYESSCKPKAIDEFLKDPLIGEKNIEVKDCYYSIYEEKTIKFYVSIKSKSDKFKIIKVSIEQNKNDNSISIEDIHRESTRIAKFNKISDILYIQLQHSFKVVKLGEKAVCLNDKPMDSIKDMQWTDNAIYVINNKELILYNLSGDQIGKDDFTDQINAFDIAASEKRVIAVLSYECKHNDKNYVEIISKDNESQSVFKKGWGSCFHILITKCILKKHSADSVELIATGFDNVIYLLMFSISANYEFALRYKIATNLSANINCMIYENINVKAIACGLNGSIALSDTNKIQNAYKSNTAIISMIHNKENKEDVFANYINTIENNGHMREYKARAEQLNFNSSSTELIDIGTKLYSNNQSYREGLGIIKVLLTKENIKTPENKNIITQLVDSIIDKHKVSSLLGGSTILLTTYRDTAEFYKHGQIL